MLPYPSVPWAVCGPRPPCRTCCLPCSPLLQSHAPPKLVAPLNSQGFAQPYGDPCCNNAPVSQHQSHRLPGAVPVPLPPPRTSDGHRDALWGWPRWDPQRPPPHRAGSSQHSPPRTPLCATPASSARGLAEKHRGKILWERREPSADLPIPLLRHSRAGAPVPLGERRCPRCHRPQRAGTAGTYPSPRMVFWGDTRGLRAALLLLL